jgi:thiol peroxidase
VTRLTLNGIPMYTEGPLPSVGREAPRLLLTASDFTDLGLDDFGRHCKVLNIVPSLELPVCAASTRHLEERLRAYADVVMLTISQDLPFASPRLGDDDARARSQRLSTFRSPSFARAWGVDIVSGPLKGLLAPAVVVLDAQHRVRHVELVREMSQEPDHAAVLAAVRELTERGATSVASTDVASVAL